MSCVDVVVLTARSCCRVDDVVDVGDVLVMQCLILPCWRRVHVIVLLMLLYGIDL